MTRSRQQGRQELAASYYAYFFRGRPKTQPIQRRSPGLIVAFDLDGTISDPAEGITSSINHALRALGQAPREERELVQFIGPPLDAIFAALLDQPDAERIREAVRLFRERYIPIGFRENVLYPDSRRMLEQLFAWSVRLYVATGKRRDVAQAVIAHFGLDHLFAAVLGCGLRRQKQELLREIAEREGRSPVMVGDRSHDMIAGREAGCLCIGVLWGYGSPEELLEAGAHELVATQEDLLSLLETQMLS